MRIYVDGVFDLFHLGHVRMLERAASMGSQLIVGVVKDEDAEQYKRRPVMTLDERMAVVQACRHVDKVVVAQLVLDAAFLDGHGIQRVLHGDDSYQQEFYAVPLEMGIMLYVPYTLGISTTDIMRRIHSRKP
jgi:cytidyltransferase-like protein